ncbi:FAD-linked oxidase [Chromatiales bacterium (ex Bugula neritina AB1)]|nr:FAD-linked oxidase [Chromatiales bacterium (ex Bugula neritina AB1)]
MSQVNLITHNGNTIQLDTEVLGQSLRGSLCLPTDDDYNNTRMLWNAMIDRKPGLIVRCKGAADVMHAVKFARDNNVLLAVRGGGHNIAGKASCDGGLMIDLSLMTSVRVDPKAHTVQVEPGALLSDVDKETQAHGLATPLGINSTTGVAGLTLGGGFGWLSRKYGLTVDNLMSVDIVTADGQLRHASVNENADLFWAIRGGGGNFGVVTQFEFRLHAIGTEVLSGLVVHPAENSEALLDQYLNIAKQAPDELSVWVVLRKAPPLPFLAEDWHGKDVLVFAACYVGDMAEGERALAPLRSLGTPIADVIGPHPFCGWQTAFDPLLESGARNYWKSHDFSSLNTEALAVIRDYAGRLPGPECEIFIAQMGGQSNRIDSDATAYPHRDTEFVLNVHTRWQDANDDERCIKWAREFFSDTEPYANGGVYVNFMADDETARVGNAYGSNFERLSKIKSEYDPDNLFRVNQNISPLK